MRAASFVLLLLVLIPRAALAEPRDPAAARELAKQAYELKQQKSWEAARVRFLESLRLDPVAKHFINVAECESELGRLVDAQGHLLEAKALAKDDAELLGIAMSRLAAVEKRMPKLTIRLGPNAPSGTVVVRDGIVLQGPSIGTSLPTDPGKHVVTATAQARASQSFDVLLAESEARELVVEPGPPVAVAPPLPPAVERDRAGEDAPSSGGFPWKTVGIVGMSAGAVGLGVGTALGFSAKSKRDGSGCNENHCVLDAQAAQLRDAKSTADLATVFFVAGGVLAAGGLAMVLFAPEPPKGSGPPTARFQIGPGSIGAAGTF